MNVTGREIAQKLARERAQGEHSDDGTDRLLGTGASFPVPVDVKTGLKKAAVLVPLVLRDAGLTVLLTQRTDHLIHHPGQISFPGGRCEDSDKTATDAALRETAEEIGLGADRIEVLGRLDNYVTITGFCVVPVVGLVHPPFALKPDPFEVADIFEVPLDFILDETNHRRDFRVTPTGQKRYYYAIPYGDRYIWGATAGMLLNLCHVLKEPCAS